MKLTVPQLDILKMIAAGRRLLRVRGKWHMDSLTRFDCRARPNHVAVEHLAKKGCVALYWDHATIKTEMWTVTDLGLSSLLEAL